MIVSFANKQTEDVFTGGRPRGLPSEIIPAAYRKLQQLNAVSAIDELRSPPGNPLEKLSGDRDGQWSIRVNDQFRICFEWTADNAEKVEIVDYH